MEYGITRCEHCGRILSADNDIDPNDLDYYDWDDPGCEYCHDYKTTDDINDNWNDEDYWL